MPNLTHERLLSVLDYQPNTGVFTWKVRSSNRTQVGDRAGAVVGNGRRFVMIDGEKFQAHRLAWFYTHGRWPDGDIRQVNGDFDDCSLVNLKEISRIEAARGRGVLVNNTSGYKGVSPAPKGGWKASVTCNYKQINLGVFPDLESAKEMVDAANSIMKDALTPVECERSVADIIQLRRKKVAWNRLVRSNRPTTWASFDEFSRDVGIVDGEDSTIAASDEAMPVGNGNFKWLSRPQGEFDRSTKEGRAAYMKAYRAVNPDRWRHSHLKNNYGVDEVEYHRMREMQDGVCAICHKAETRDRKMSFDHDHATGKVRALLCSGCNQAIGYIKENPDALTKAVEYLKKHQSPAALESKPTRPDRDWLLVATPNFEGPHG